MNKKEFLKDMKMLIKFYNKFKKLYDQLDKLFGSFDGEVMNFYAEIEEALIKLVEDKFKDHERFIGWYIFDNDCGKKQYKVNDKPIKNLNDLWGVINV